MDPKTLAGLDPKLRETYEKVMGAAANAQQTSAPATAATAIISNTPIPPPVIPQAPLEAKPTDTPASSIPAEPAEQKTADVLSSSLESNPGLSAQPVQPAEMSNLQPSLTGSPLPASEGAAAILNKPLQPLPSPASVNQQAAASGGTSGVLKIVYVIAGVVFFIVYAIFWMKIFNFPLPF